MSVAAALLLLQALLAQPTNPAVVATPDPTRVAPSGPAAAAAPDPARVAPAVVAPAVPTDAARIAPEFAVRTQDGVLHTYPATGAQPGAAYRVDDEVVAAHVSALGQDLWRLRIDRAKHDLREVYFPWQSQRLPLDAELADDIYYWPLHLGMTLKATEAKTDFGWYGSDINTYPGGFFAPLALVADGDDARIVAAANWPPRAVLPQHDQARMVLRYSQGVRRGASGEWTALIARVRGDATVGQAPWQIAVRRYRAWLDSRFPPPSYPEWMWRGEGFINVQLENIHENPEAEARRLWNAHRDVYPWILFWGQMSAYAGDCCALDPNLHPRYASWLPRFLREEVQAKGFHGGMYAAPYYGSDDKPAKQLDTKEGVDFLKDWVALNRRLGASAYYIDTLGGRFYGDPVSILPLFRSPTVPEDSLIEGAVDVYPTPLLISGASTAFAPACGAPWKRPEDWPSAGFARFGRYLLGDRLVFLGGSNHGWLFWGEQRGYKLEDHSFVKACGYAKYCEQNGPCDHWTEREVFLLGAKFDMLWPENNPVLDRILELRKASRWWDRRPVYLDTEGLDQRAIPRGNRVDVRRHRDRFGRNLLTVYNERSLSGFTVRVDGRQVALPADKFSIVEVPGP